MTAAKTERPANSPRYSKEYFKRYAERQLKLDYAMLRLPKSDLAFKTKDQDPRVWFTAKYIPERAQVALHLRVPTSDEWNQLSEFIDLDIYFPKDQLGEMMKVLNQPAEKEQIMKLQCMSVTGRQLAKIFRELMTVSKEDRSVELTREVSKRKRRHRSRTLRQRMRDAPRR